MFKFFFGVLSAAMVAVFVSPAFAQSHHDHHHAPVPPVVLQPVAPSEVTDLRILSGDMFFRVEGQEAGQSIVLEAGKRYRLSFVNVGSVMHEVLFGRNPSIEEDGTPGDYTEAMLENVPVKVKGKFKNQNGKDVFFEVEAPGLEELEIGTDTTLMVIFTVPESLRGEWEIGCFMPGHYMAGMKLPVVVR